MTSVKHTGLSQLSLQGKLIKSRRLQSKTVKQNKKSMQNKKSKQNKRENFKARKGEKVMRAKKFVACALSAAMMLGLASMTGCGSSKKDYDLYIYNTKSEIADSIQDLCKEYETETGVKVKVYTCGTQETMETLRSEMDSEWTPSHLSRRILHSHQCRQTARTADAMSANAVSTDRE